MQKYRHLHTIAQLCRAISSQLRHASTIRKNLLSSNTSPTGPYNMVNFGPLAGEIVSLVCWGATCIRQGGHHVGHWHTFLVVTASYRLTVSTEQHRMCGWL